MATVDWFDHLRSVAARVVQVDWQADGATRNVAPGSFWTQSQGTVGFTDADTMQPVYGPSSALWAYYWQSGDIIESVRIEHAG